MYHVFKQTQIYEGHAYCGPMTTGTTAEFKTLAEAKEARCAMNEANPVGWNIFDAETGVLVEGHDFFDEG